MVRLGWEGWDQLPLPFRGDGFGSSPPLHPPTGTDPPCPPISHLPWVPTTLPAPAGGTSEGRRCLCCCCMFWGETWLFLLLRKHIIFLRASYRFSNRRKGGIAAWFQPLVSLLHPQFLPQPHREVWGCCFSTQSTIFIIILILLSFSGFPEAAEKKFPDNSERDVQLGEEWGGCWEPEPSVWIKWERKSRRGSRWLHVESGCWGAQFWGQASPKHRAAMVPTSQTPKQRSVPRKGWECVFSRKRN